MTTFVSVAERKAELSASVELAKELLANLAAEALEAYTEYPTGQMAFSSVNIHLDTAWRTLQYATEALSN